MGRIHDKDLPKIAGIGKDLLVAGHAGIKTDLAGRCADGTEGQTMMDRSVSEHQNSGGR
jgi:hypothetical protein